MMLYKFSFPLNVISEIQSMDIERFSDRGKPRITSERDSLDQFLQLTSKNFPKELIGGLQSEITKYESNACIMHVYKFSPLCSMVLLIMLRGSLCNDNQV
jgi:hypothetical protein